MKNLLKKWLGIQQHIAAGGGLGRAPNSRQLRRKMESFYTENGISWKRVLKTPGDFVELLDRIVTASETATRVGEFRRGLQKGLTPEQAAFEAREIAVDYLNLKTSN